MKNTLLKLAAYNQWANAKIIDLLKAETPQLIEKEIASSFNSINKTLMHIADAEYIWHCRLNNLPFTNVPGKSGKTIDVLKETNKQLLDFVSAKDESYFSHNTTYKTLKGEPFTNNNFAILLHVFNHGTFHRGQVISMMRNAGYSGAIESTDLIAFERL